MLRLQLESLSLTIDFTIGLTIDLSMGLTIVLSTGLTIDSYTAMGLAETVKLLLQNIHLGLSCMVDWVRCLLGHVFPNLRRYTMRELGTSNRSASRCQRAK